MSRQNNLYIRPLKIWALFITVLTFISCSGNNLADFPESTELSGHALEQISVLTDGNVKLVVADTFLVLQKAEEDFIQIYNTNTLDLLVEFGDEGRGPGEFMGPSLIKQVNYDEENNSPIVYVFDYKRKMVSTINILKAIQNQDAIEQMSLPSGNHWLPYFYHLGNEFYLATPSREGRFLIHDYQTSENKIIPYIPKLGFEVPSQSLSMVYRSFSVFNRDLGLIASAPLFLGEINFFDLEGNIVRSAIFESRDRFKDELSGNPGDWENIEYQIGDIDTMNGLIYGLDYNNSITTFYTEHRENNLEIVVFDWSGNPVKKYILDDRLVTSFAVDPVHDLVYAYAPNEPESQLIQYNI